MKLKKIWTIVIAFFLLICFIPFSGTMWNVDAVSAPKLYNEGLNILKNGKFDGWEQSDNVDWAYTSTVKDNVLKEDKCAFISGSKASEKEWITLLYVDNDDSRFSLSVGVTYVASINYFATQSSMLTIKFAKSNLNVLHSESFEVTGGNWNKVSVRFTPKENISAKIKFEITNLIGDIYLDDAFLGIDGESSFLKIDYGAYLKLENDSCGIRFRGRIDKAYLDKIKADSTKSEISYGILLTKTNPEQKDYTTPENITADIFTVEALVEYDIPYMLMEANRFYNETSCESDGFYGFNCAIIKIKEENFTQSFSARTYLKYTENGNVIYEYSDYSEKENARSLDWLVNSAYEEKEIFSEEEQILLEQYKLLIG